MYKRIDEKRISLEVLTEQLIELTRTVMSLAHEVKLIDERLHDLEVKNEKSQL